MTPYDYDAETGRFLKEDPIGFEGGINLHLYAGGNPIAFVDASGLGPTSGCVAWSCQSTPQSMANFVGGALSGAGSVMVDSFYTFPRQAGRHLGLLGSEHYNNAMVEEAAMSAYVQNAPSQNYTLERAALNHAANTYNSNPDYYGGRAVTGLIVSPLGIVANVGAVFNGVEQGHGTLNGVLFGEQ